MKEMRLGVDGDAEKEDRMLRLEIHLNIFDIYKNS